MVARSWPLCVWHRWEHPVRCRHGCHLAALGRAGAARVSPFGAYFSRKSGCYGRIPHPRWVSLGQWGCGEQAGGEDLWHSMPWGAAGSLQAINTNNSNDSVRQAAKKVRRGQSYLSRAREAIHGLSRWPRSGRGSGCWGRQGCCAAHRTRCCAPRSGEGDSPSAVARSHGWGEIQAFGAACWQVAPQGSLVFQQRICLARERGCIFNRTAGQVGIVAQGNAAILRLHGF